MDNFGNRVKAGLLILAGLAVLIGGYIWFTQFRLSRSIHRYKVKVETASWIQKGTLVTISGVPKGRVDAIQLYAESVIIFISIEDYSLMEGASAYIENQGVMGERRIDIYMGDGDTLATWATIPGEDSPTIGDLVDYAGKLLEDVDSLAVESRSALRGASQRMDILQIQLTATLSEIENLAAELRASTRKISVRSDTTFARIDSLVTHMDSVTVALKTLVESEGTVQRLAEDDKLYKDLEKTIKSAQELIEDIQANPKRYITIEIF